MRMIALSLRSLRREWRAGELRVLTLALVVAVAAVTSVGFFTDRVRLLLVGQAGEFIAADLRLSGARPIDEAWAAEARRRSLAIATTASFPSVVLAGERAQLVSVKAVGAGYPLRGRLASAAGPFAESLPGGVPAPGTAWLEPRLFALLGVAPGDTLQLGHATLKVSAALTYEPDRGSGFVDLAPRLLFSAADLEATGLILPGSRVRYALLAAGEETVVGAFRRWLEPRLPVGVKLETARDARPELRDALDRAERFFGLAALVSVVLAGVAVALAARRHAVRHLDGAAVMRCLGAGQGQLAALFLGQLVWLGLLATAVGSLVGYGAQQGLMALLAPLLPATPPPPSPLPLASGALTALAALVGFALPPLLQLKRVPPARVLRRDLGAIPPAGWGVYGAALATLAALIAWVAGDATLAAFALGGLAATVALLALSAWLLVRGLRPLRGRVGISWRWGLANIGRRAGGSVAQVTAFGLGIMALLLLGIVRVDLMEGWRARLPADAPNQFLINIQPGEVEPLRQYLADAGMTPPEFYPMVRGRLVAIDGREVGPEDYENSRAQRLVAREFNLSWSGGLHPGNRVVAGHWWPEVGAAPQLSVEEGLAETLGIGLGDELAFEVAGERIRAPVTSLRALEWDSFRVNFFVTAPPGVLEGFPATFITSFHLPPGRKGALAGLVERFPSVTAIDVEALMGQVRGIVERVTLALEYVFLFTLAAGLAVLYAAIQSTRDERLREAALLRTLGARTGLLRKGMMAEFAVIGLLAGVIASLAAAAAGWAVSTQVFHLAYRPDPLLWLLGPLGGMVGVGGAGLFGVRRVLALPPIAVLRR